MHDYLDEQQLKAVEALQNLKLICEKNHITYFLLAGSTLGAVRHQGFIPWDDDIDIGVFYDDWYKLRKLLIKELPNDFVYMDNIIDPDFPRFFGNIIYHGKILIDIFMIVKWTSQKINGYFHWQIKRLALQCHKFSIHYTSIDKRTTTLKQKVRKYSVLYLRKIIYYILHIFYGRDDFIRMARWNEKCFMNRETDYYINIYSIYKMEKEMIKKEWLSDLSQVLFEGEYYTTVSNTDAYLTHLYGDYMTPPPYKERIKLHDQTLI